MPIELVWDDREKTILRWEMVGEWDWEMVMATAAESGEMRGEVEHDIPVAVIINMEHAAIMRPDAIRQTRKALLVSPENRDLIVIAGRSIYTRTVVDIFRKLYVGLADYIVPADTVEEARRLIAEHREQRET